MSVAAGIQAAETYAAGYAPCSMASMKTLRSLLAGAIGRRRRDRRDERRDARGEADRDHGDPAA